MVFLHKVCCGDEEENVLLNPGSLMTLIVMVTINSSQRFLSGEGGSYQE